MKKVFLLFSAFALTATSFAQEPAQEVMKSKRGYVILPQAGDIALGFDAVPVLNFALNAADIMSNEGTTAAHPNYVSGFSNIIVGKYFLKDNMAIRGRFGTTNIKTTTKSFDEDPLSTAADPENILISTKKVAENSYFLAAGVEKRRGHNRLQGFYGAELLLGFNSASEKYSYEIDYNQASADLEYMAEGDSRPLSIKDGLSATVGLRGFIGVEYFVAPKISIGAEFGWGLGLVTTPRGKEEHEFWDLETDQATTPSAFTEETEGPESSRVFKFEVDNGSSDVLGTSGALSIHFHF
jgi:hypothetical protein